MNGDAYRREELRGGISVCVSSAHTFGTDAILLAHFSAPRSRETACDLCSGCGIVPLFWFAAGTPPACALALDIQPGAVGQMARAREWSSLGERFVPIHGDLRQSHPELPEGKLDLVTCNPPYRRPGTGALSADEPSRAARHEIYCTLEEVCAAARRLLRFGGRFCICHLPERLTDVLSAMRVCGIEPKRLRMVHQRPDRAPWLVLVEGKRGGKPSLKVESPLFMEHANGEASGEIREIYGVYATGEKG